MPALVRRTSTSPCRTVAFFDNLAFGAADENWLKVPTELYDLQVRLAGESNVVLWFVDVPLASNIIHTVYAVGTLDDESIQILMTLDDRIAGGTTMEFEPETSKMRVAHLSPDAPNVDVWIDGALVPGLANVPFEAVGEYLELVAATHRIQIFATGETVDPVIDTGITLDPRLDHTVAATGQVMAEVGNPRRIAATVITYDGRTPDIGEALVRFVHTSPDAPAVDVRVANGGPTLSSDKSFRQISDLINLTADTYDLEVVLTDGGAPVLSVPGVTFGPTDVVTIYATGFAGDASLNALLVAE